MVLLAAAALAAGNATDIGSALSVDGVQGPLQPVLQTALAAAWAIPGITLARHRIELPFWWLALVAAAAHASAAVVVSIAPSNVWCEWFALWLIVVEVPILGAIVQIFPTGRPLARWRWYLVISMAGGGVGILAAAVEALPIDALPTARDAAGVAAIGLLAFAGIGGVVPLIARARTTVDPERRAAIGLIVALAAGFAVPGLVAAGGRSGEVAAQVFTAAQLGFVAVIVLRARVWGLAPMRRRSLHQVVAATDTERRRMRAELHDGIGAALTAVRLKVDAAQRLAEQRPARTTEILGSASDDIGAVLDEVRRLLEGLRPAILDRMNVADALRERIDEISTHALGLSIERHGIDRLRPLPPGADAAVYRLVTEALSNVVRHADARRCEVRVDTVADDLVIDVIDDGQSNPGTDVDRVGIGLSSMSARAAEVGGYVVAGPQPGGGFRVRATIPTGEP